MAQFGRVICVITVALLLTACDKCGGLALGVWASPASSTCSSDKPQG